MANETNSTLNKLKQYFWLFVTIGVLIIYWMFKQLGFTTAPASKTTTEITTNNAQVDSLRKVIIVQQDQIEAYDATEEALRDSIISLRSQIKKNTQLSNQINTKTNEKANNTVLLNSNELFQFLADRYKDSIRFQR